MKLANKKVLITGGTSGLGLAIAKIMVDKGAQVIALGKSAKGVASAQSLITDPLFTTQQLDISNYREVESLITDHGNVDVLVNAAGVWLEGGVETNDPELIQTVINTNLTGLIYATRAVLPGMQSTGVGHIINISSTSGIKPRGDKQAVYAASKWGVQGFTESLKLELIGTGIKVYGVYPGGMHTPMFAKAGTPKNNEAWMDPMDVAALIVQNLENSDKLHVDHIVINRLNK